MFSARNGAYTTVVERVRQAFGTDEVVRLDCKHVGSSDCKRIGVKLRVRVFFSFSFTRYSLTFKLVGVGLWGFLFLFWGSGFGALCAYTHKG